MIASPSAVVVREATTVEPGMLAVVNHLVRQLSTTAAPLTEADLERVVSSEATRLLLAWAGEDVVGMTTLVLVPIPTGLRAIIEDVVVDERGRGHGVGRALVTRALALAEEAGATTVDLTSRPTRVAAHALYRSVGFVERDTSVYRYRLGGRSVTESVASDPSVSTE